MSDGSYQVTHFDTDNSYIEYQSWQYFHERKWHCRLWRKLQRFADWFDATFGWFFCPRRYTQVSNPARKGITPKYHE